MKWFKQFIMNKAVLKSPERERCASTLPPSISLVLETFPVQCFSVMYLGLQMGHELKMIGVVNNIVS